jgi:hypothetical protein
MTRPNKLRLRTTEFKGVPLNKIVLCGMLSLSCIAMPQPSMAASAKAGKGGVDIGIMAFKEICLGTAPSFASGVAKAKRYGVTKFFKLGEGSDGMSPDNSISVQIKPNKECAITTTNRADQTLSRQFLTAVATVAKGVPDDDKGAPFHASVRGHVYVFFHDRKGGEAYVMESLGK